MQLQKLKQQINQAQKQLDCLQTQYRAETGHNWNGAVGAINYDYEFEHDDELWIRFNYLPPCPGYGHHPDEPAQVEVVQIIFYGMPLFASQENALMDSRREEIEEACWAYLKSEGEIPVEKRRTV